MTADEMSVLSWMSRIPDDVLRSRAVHPESELDYACAAERRRRENLNLPPTERHVPVMPLDGFQKGITPFTAREVVDAYFPHGPVPDGVLSMREIHDWAVKHGMTDASFDEAVAKPQAPEALQCPATLRSVAPPYEPESRQAIASTERLGETHPTAESEGPR